MTTRSKGGPLALIAAGAGLLLVSRKFMQPKRLDLSGQVVLITGSSRGLGLALAEEFARHDARIVLTAHDEDELERARLHIAQLGAEVLAIPCDVTRHTEVQSLVDKVTLHYGHIDVLVNNAGIITVGPLQAQTLEDFQDSMNTIFWGAYHATMAVLPQMYERHNGQIVNITSIGGKVSVPHLLSYSSAKFALEGFSEGLHSELAKEGIHVLTVAPGLMRTGSQVNAFTKGKHEKEYTWFALAATLPFTSMNVRRAAQQIVRATQRRSTQVVITFQATLLDRFHALFPGLMANMLILVDRLLPKAGETQGLERSKGKDSQTAISKSFLTALGQKAAHTYNQYPDNATS